MAVLVHFLYFPSFRGLGYRVAIQKSMDYYLHIVGLKRASDIKNCMLAKYNSKPAPQNYFIRYTVNYLFSIVFASPMKKLAVGLLKVYKFRRRIVALPGMFRFGVPLTQQA